MANNRLYIVNKETKEYVCIAKSFGYGWCLGNINLLSQFVNSVKEFGDKANIIVGTENDEAFFENHIKEGINLNTDNKWQYAL